MQTLSFDLGLPLFPGAVDDPKTSYELTRLYNSVHLLAALVDANYNSTSTTPVPMVQLVASASTTLMNNQHIVVPNNLYIIYLPVVPAPGYKVEVTNTSAGAVTVDRSNENIFSLPNNFSLDAPNKTGLFEYVNASIGWVVFLG